MKRRLTGLFAFFAIVLLGVCGFAHLRSDRSAPVIRVPDTQISYKRGEDERHLLAGVTATDDRDGDVSASLRIGNVFFSEDGSRICVTYVAKDSANNLRQEIVWYTFLEE